MHVNRIIKVLFFVFFLTQVQAQNVNLTGIVRDTSLGSLGFVTVTATAQDSNVNSVFTLANSEGYFKLALTSGQKYFLEISFLGYETYRDTIQLFRDVNRDIVLASSSIKIKEVLVRQKRLAYRIAGDSVIYTVDSFNIGTERKLRHTLERLPGIEVDRAGLVYYNGKKISKLLVDGKPFFNGNTKLGVNNIPANAVDQVEVLKNFSEISMLKGFKDSDKIALNIKLKKDKKKFVFGDVEIGCGVKNRYLVRPNIFYYSPKTNINFIGDMNNIGEKVFTFSDYIDFEGGVAELFVNHTKISSLTSNRFARSLLANNFYHRNDYFGAISVAQALPKGVNLRFYSINTQSMAKEKNLLNNSYNIGSTSFLETQNLTKNRNSFFSVNKLDANYIKKDIDIRFKTLYQISRMKRYSELYATTSVDTNQYQNLLAPMSSSLDQSIHVNKRFSTKNVLSFNGRLKYSLDDAARSMEMTAPHFLDLISLLGGSPYIVLSKDRTRKKSGLFELGDYWKVKSTQHLFFLMGLDVRRQIYDVGYHQLFNEKPIILQKGELDNNIVFDWLDGYGGLRYTVRVGRTQIESGLEYHVYRWSVQQKNSNKIGANQRLQPSFSFKWDVASGQKVMFKYNESVSVKGADAYANTLNWIAFNRLSRGNENLEQTLIHRVAIEYTRSKLFKGYSLLLGVNYDWKPNAIRPLMEFDNQYSVLALAQSNLLTESINGTIQYSKKARKIKWRLNSRVSIDRYSLNVDKQIRAYRAISIMPNISFRTRGKKHPNIRFRANSQMTNSWVESRKSAYFYVINPFAGVEYWYKDKVNFVADYNFHNYHNLKNNSTLSYQGFDASFKYDSTHSPWLFKVTVSNAFNNGERIKQTVSNVLAQELIENVQPRIVMFSIAYKL